LGSTRQTLFTDLSILRSESRRNTLPDPAHDSRFESGNGQSVGPTCHYRKLTLAALRMAIETATRHQGVFIIPIAVWSKRPAIMSKSLNFTNFESA